LDKLIVVRDNLSNTAVSRKRLYESAAIDNVKYSKSQIAYSVLKKRRWGGDRIKKEKE